MILKPLENTSTYSNDLWDYLVDMRYMPSRHDRDVLVKEADSDILKRKRVVIWDYFFRINPDDVAKPQKQEIAELEKSMANAERHLSGLKDKLEGERSRISRELEKTQKELNDLRDSAQALATKQFKNSNQRKRLFGFIGALASSPFLILPLCNFLFSITNQNQSSGGNTTVFDNGLIFNFICCYSIGLPIFGIAMWMILNSNPSREKILRGTKNIIENAEKKFVPSIQDLAQKLSLIPVQINTMQAEFDSASVQYNQRIQALKSAVEDLVSQIPVPTSDEQIDIWLKEDIRHLGDVATSRSGLQDKLSKVLKAENPFCIRGPAELQIKELIPVPYRDAKSDRNKHFRARQFVIMPDGSFADFYGVYNIEFILVANDILATYGTFYDFIAGKQSGERTTGQHYADVVSIKTQKGYREIELENGEKLTMENVPSLGMTLTSGDRIDVTFPDEEYFRQIKARGFATSKWRFDPYIAADNAIKTVREKVDEAKRKREINSNNPL